jgi:hypothetical protein
VWETDGQEFKGLDRPRVVITKDVGFVENHGQIFGDKDSPQRKSSGEVKTMKSGVGDETISF